MTIVSVRCQKQSLPRGRSVIAGAHHHALLSPRLNPVTLPQELAQRYSPLSLFGLGAHLFADTLER
jgi:hypothetical protein